MGSQLDQKFPHIMDPIILYHDRKKALSVHILSQMTPVCTLPFSCIKIHFNIVPSLCQCRTCQTSHYLQKTPWPYQSLQLSRAVEYPWPAWCYLYQLGRASDCYLQSISATSIPHTSTARSMHIWRFCSHRTTLPRVNVHHTYIILDFKLSPWFEYCIYSFGYFPGVKL